MKPEDDNPTEEELREAAALAAALEGRADPANAAGGGANAPDGEAPADALETAALLRHARTPLAVPPAHEPIAAAHVAPVLDARRAGGRRRSRRWIGASLIVPVVAAAWLMYATVRSTSERAVPLPAPLPAPTADLLAAQAEAIRGGSNASAALAALDSKMRAYRRQYHDGLRRRGGGQP